LKIFRRKRVVFDVHEFYPSMFAETRFPASLQWLGAGLIKGLYYLLSPFTDAIVLANRYISEDFEGIKNTYVMVENFGLLNSVETLTAMGIDNSRYDSDPFTLVHVGLFASERGSHVVLEAAAEMNDPRLHLDLVGRIVDESPLDYQKRIDKLGLTDNVNVVEWVEYTTMLEHLAKAHAGFVFFQSGSRTNAAGLPHKLFDYMAAGIPILVSKYSRYVAEIVTDSNCGWVIDSENPKEINETLHLLMNEPEIARDKGANGRRALIDRYNWQTEADKLIELYKGFDSGE